jgi:Trypsin-like peptidase domain
VEVAFWTRFSFQELPVLDQISPLNLETRKVLGQFDTGGYRLVSHSLKVGFLFLLSLLIWLGRLNADTIPQIVAKAKQAVVQITAFDEKRQPLKTGTGFFVTGDGYLLTNNHVIAGASYILAQTSSGAAYNFEAVVVRSADPDLAMLKFTTTDVPHLQLGSSADTVEGQKVLVIGNPEGLQGTVSDGIVAAFRDDRTYIQITAPISPGSSGSPVLDESGQVIGMATLVFREGQNLNFAISSERIQSFLLNEVNKRQAQATPSATPPNTSPQPEAVAQSSLVVAVNRAITNHDWQGLTNMTVSGLVNYFGHRHVSNAFIAQDMQNDSRNYVWVHSTVYPDSFTHEVSDQYSSNWSGPMLYDSINTYTEAMERNGKLHKATTRLTVGYVINSSGRPAIYSLTLKVL